MSFMMLRNHLCFLCGREKNKIRRSTKITLTSPKALWRRETVSLNFLLPFALFPLLVAVWSRLRARFSSLVSKFYAVLWLGRWCYRPWHRLRQIWPPKGFIPFFVFCRGDVLCYGFCGRVLDCRRLPSGCRLFWSWPFYLHVRVGDWTGGAWEESARRNPGVEPWCGALVWIYFTVALLLLAVKAYFVRSWRTFLILSSAPLTAWKRLANLLVIHNCNR